MSEVFFKLGDFAFSVDTAAPQTVRGTTEWRWPAQERLGEPALQYVGVGPETMEIEGVIYPHHRGGLKQIDAMKAEAGRGVPLLLISESGAPLGYWAITRIVETRSEFVAGGVPAKVEFRLSIAKVGADAELQN